MVLFVQQNIDVHGCTPLVTWEQDEVDFVSAVDAMIYL